MHDEPPDLGSLLVVAALVEACNLTPDLLVQMSVAARLPEYEKIVHELGLEEGEDTELGFMQIVFMTENGFLRFYQKHFRANGDCDYRKQQVLMNLATAAFLIGINNIRLRPQPSFEKVDCHSDGCTVSTLQAEEEEYEEQG